MINNNTLTLGKERSAIRELFEQGKILKEKCGNDKVYDFSIGNPSVPCPKEVNDTLIHLLSTFDSTKLHGYSSAQGDKNVRDAISQYLNKTYDAVTSGDLIYLTTGAAAALTISLKALTSGNGNDEVIVFAPYFPEYAGNTRRIQAIILLWSQLPLQARTSLPDLWSARSVRNSRRRQTLN